MDFLKEYGSSDSEAMDSEDSRSIEGELSENTASISDLHGRAVRQVYLITYSQADCEKFPTRESFAKAVVRSFEGTDTKVLQWVCCKEPHQSKGYHYHMAIKLNRCKRWLSSKKYLQENHGISVHFSDAHYNYYSAWKYTTKTDKYVLESDNHPDLWDSKAPKTESASISRKKNVVESESSDSSDEEDENTSNCFESASCRESNTRSKKRKKRMTSFELSEIIITKSIKTRTELLAYANKQKLQGKSDIAEFIVNRGPRVVSEVLTTAWEMTSAQHKLDRSKKTRIEILEQAAQGQCVSGCNGQWLTCASEVLQQNGIRKEAFANAIKDLLEKGRSKFRNLMICGPANSAKTFMLSPLTSIYKTFSNPACTSFAWVGAQEAECIFLNDFRWSPQVIQWHDFLLMLEGQLVHLPAPKTHYARDIIFEKDTPIFCTGKQPFIYIKNGVIDQRETEMMSVRWKIFHFNVQIEQNVQKEIPKCPKCFASVVLY